MSFLVQALRLVFGSGAHKHSEFYETYMRSAAWRAVRVRIMNRASGRCEFRTLGIRCPRAATQVHHLNYDRLGHEEDSDLMAVCVLHHRKADRRRRRRRF